MRLVLGVCLLALGGWMCVDAASVKASILQGFTEPMQKCLQQRKVLYSVDQQCHDLPENNGVCSMGKWLVLDSARQNSTTNRFDPVCKTKLCTGLFQLYWPSDQSCHKSTEVKTLCPFPGHELVSDKYGEGMCECRKEPPHLRHGSSSSEGPCYQLYKRGPCPEGSNLQAQHVPNKDRIGVCRPDPCFNKTRRSPSKTFALYDGKCYPLDDRGPCLESLTFKVSQRTLAPDCVGETYSIFTLPPRCFHDQAGDCMKEIILAQEDKEAEAFNLIQQVIRKRKRSSPLPKG